MDLVTFFVVIATFVSWGVGSIIAKLAASRIGTQSVFWDASGYFLAVFLYGLVVFKFKNLIQADKIGMGLAFLAGAVGSFGIVGFYFLMTRVEASTVVPLTALYPALTVALAIIFLHESLTPPKLLGIILSLVAIYLLSK